MNTRHNRRRFVHQMIVGAGMIAHAGLLTGPCRAFGATGTGLGGFSAVRLKALRAAMQGFVDRSEVAGIVTVLYRHGVLAQMEAIGWQDKEARLPMKHDAIFRLASMSKPLLAAATLTLMDEGKLSLDDPVEKFVPELANRKVMRDPAGSLEDTVSAIRPIRIVDLLTHRSGLTPGVAVAATLPDAVKSPLTQAMIEADKARQVGTDAWLSQVASLPLAYQPGSKFNYGISFDLLGAVLPRVTGRPLPDFMRERLFEPLAMKDTGFQVPPEKQTRLAAVYSADAVTKKIVPKPDTVLPQLSPQSFPSGEGGLYCTAHDYLQAATMLLGRGRRGSVRILSHRAVTLMTSNHLSLEERKGWKGHGFGLSVEIVEDFAEQNAAEGTSPIGKYASVGSYGWPGYWGCCWVVDPQEDMVQLFMIQLPTTQGSLELFKAFQLLAYQAIDD